MKCVCAAGIYRDLSGALSFVHIPSTLDALFFGWRIITYGHHIES